MAKGVSVPRMNPFSRYEKGALSARYTQIPEAYVWLTSYRLLWNDGLDIDFEP